MKLKVALGDLRHRTTGRHSVFMPIGIGFIGAYLLGNLPENSIDLRLYDDPDILLDDIDKWKPDVIGLSNYCWNSSVSCLVYRYAKRQKPQTWCISGGPDFPTEEHKCLQYLQERPEIDFYVYREGEIVFAHLVNRILNKQPLKGVAHDGVMHLDSDGKLLVGKPVPKLKSLDEIPSPYLMGLMDQFFNGEYAPSMEFARGCPFTCGYCYAGQSWCSPIARFSVERIKADLDYIAIRMQRYPNVLLSICDSNFGMYAEDEEIAEHISHLQDVYGWPNAFDVTTGKAKYDRIIGIVKKLKNTMKVACSVQSMNPDTLNIIKRHNIAFGDYKALIEEIKDLKMMSAVGLIIPMPLESKETFLQGIKLLFESGVEQFVVYTTMLLQATYLDHDDCRSLYAYRTGFRIIPRQFGKYKGESCYEIEEVCTSTNTMSFSEYLECRGFAFLVALLSSEQFDVIRMHLKEFGISAYDYLYALWRSVEEGDTEISQIYKEFKNETEQELFSSRQDVYDYFDRNGNYDKLLRGDLGDNLLRKFITKILLTKSDEMFHLSYFMLGSIAELDEDESEALRAAEAWVSAARKVSNAFDRSFGGANLVLEYDVSDWYSSDSKRKLIEYNRKTDYTLRYDKEKMDSVLNEARGLYGDDFGFMVGKLLVNLSVKTFWAESKRSGEW